jgi:hypothetical protein
MDHQVLLLTNQYREVLIHLTAHCCIARNIISSYRNKIQNFKSSKKIKESRMMIKVGKEQHESQHMIPNIQNKKNNPNIGCNPEWKRIQGHRREIESIDY